MWKIKYVNAKYRIKSVFARLYLRWDARREYDKVSGAESAVAELRPHTHLVEQRFI